MSNLLRYGGHYTEDLAIGVWWMKMHTAGELGDMLLPSAQTLAGLLKLFQPPNALLYASDPDDGIWAAAWYEQLMNGVFMGMWIAPERRKSKAGLKAVLDLSEAAMYAAPCCFVVTKQEKLVDGLQRLGYALLTKAPRLWSVDRDAWILMLTRPAFEAAKAKYARVYPARTVPEPSGVSDGC